MQKDKISLMNIADGAVIDMFENAIRKVEGNIKDPSTSASSTRKITIEVTFNPDETRQMMGINVSVSTSLAHIKPVKAGALMDLDDDGKPAMFVVSQADEERELPGNVLSMERLA